MHNDRKLGRSLGSTDQQLLIMGYLVWVRGRVREGELARKAERRGRERARKILREEAWEKPGWGWGGQEEANTVEGRGEEIRDMKYSHRL